jgi:MFS family permease
MRGFSPALLALILGQVCLHSCMAGVRVAAPLLMLNQGHPAWVVGLLLGLFAAAPVTTSLRVGRMADRLGYHRPMHLAVALTAGGGLLAGASVWLTSAAPHSTWAALDALRSLPEWCAFAGLSVAAMLCGVGANMGLITIQRHPQPDVIPQRRVHGAAICRSGHEFLRSLGGVQKVKRPYRAQPSARALLGRT